MKNDELAAMVASAKKYVKSVESELIEMGCTLDNEMRQLRNITRLLDILSNELA